ncbi:antibiotic biosynthesis monooxygenase [Kitasatospora sp. NPDC049285]|uniref:antibiotic biosynthesis monooxygenase n=1 Tax=Kitasatospora sp. NPDC049285 TaxID=3157096 RepID=UPI003433A3C6
MLTLPWTPGPATLRAPATPVVMAAELRVRSLRYVPGFLRHSLRIRRQTRTADGALGVTLRAAPLRGTFWVLSAWTDREALGRFVKTDPHRTAMLALRPHMAGSHFATWDATSPGRPDWEEAMSQLQASRGPGNGGGTGR